MIRASIRKTAAIEFGLALLAAAIPLSPISALPASAAGSAAAGKSDFATHCAGCHATDPGKNGIGPSLAGIVGSKAGTVPGYEFSTAMKQAHLTWNQQTLDRFLANPQGVVPGTKMYVGVPDAAARQNIIAYLATIKK